MQIRLSFIYANDISFIHVIYTHARETTNSRQSDPLVCVPGQKMAGNCEFVCSANRIDALEKLLPQGIVSRNVRFGSKVGQIGPKWD